MKLLNLLFISLFLFQCSNLNRIDSKPLSKEKQVQKYLQRIPASVQDDFKNAKAEIVEKLKVLQKQIKKRKFKLNVLQDKTSNIFQDLKTKLEKIKNEIEEKNSDEINNDPSLSKILNQVNKLIKSISEEDVYAANTYKKLGTLVEKYIPKYKGFLKRLWDGIVRHKWKIAVGLAGTAVLAGGGYIAYNQYYGKTGQKQKRDKKAKTTRYRVSKEEQKFLNEIKHITNVNSIYKDDYIHRTLLEYAAEQGYLNAVKYLIKKGADVNKEGPLLSFPLHFAVQSGSLSTVKYLTKHGANIENKEYHGDSTAFLESVLLLLQGKFSNRKFTKEEMLEKMLKIIRYLADQGANINTRDTDGETPLHHAVAHNSLFLVKYLIEQGADENIKNNDGKTPLDLAIKYKNKKIINFLK